MRAAAVGDLDRVAAIEARCFATHAYGRWTVRQYFDMFGPLFLVAEDEDLLGYVVGGVPLDDPETGWVLNLAVDPAHRRRGAGRALSATLLDAMGRRGLGSCRLSVDPGNLAALALYRALGWSVVGTEPSYFGEGAARTLMRVDLGPAL